MNLTSAETRLTSDIRDSLASIACDGSVAGKGPALRHLSTLFQGMAICCLLADTDTHRFRANLIRSAQARRYHLRRAHAEGLRDDRLLGLSKSAAIFDCVVAGASELVNDIVHGSASDWQPAAEYEDDFCYLSFIHGMLGQPDFLRAPESAALLQRFSAVLEGQQATRLTLCQAIRERNVLSFQSAFTALLSEHKTNVVTRKANASDRTTRTLVELQSTVSIEALAWLAFARGMGMPMENGLSLCPDAARGLTPPAPEVDDLFDHLDAALRADHVTSGTHVP
ncbi:MAG: hypothetical protein RLZZ618_1038 [Pseudomonadota bacterium]|jgi:hypothetical protein